MPESFHDLLSRIAGHFVPSSSPAAADVRALHDSLSRSLLPADATQLKTSAFAFESADFLAPSSVSPEVSTALRAVATAQEHLSTEAPRLRAFVRDVAVRSPQIPGSIPSWAVGAALDHTAGPFANKDGRQLWFDFFVVEKLEALYLPTGTMPALLFDVSARLGLLGALLHPGEAKARYPLAAGSIWILTRLLASNAPADRFTGLRIKGGSVVLSTAAKSTPAGKLTLLAGTTVTVELDLDQSVPASDPSSPYGVDARRATLQLPARLVFHFSDSAQAITEAGPAEWKVLGDAAAFTWSSGLAAAWNSALNNVVIPYVCAPGTFTASDSESPFCAVTGQADLVASAWVLPAATIDILHPTAAAGTGAMLVACGPGLSMQWAGLEGGALRLKSPLITAEPGHIAIADLAAGDVTGTQKLRLWAERANKFGTQVRLQYSAEAPLFFNSFASGEEALAVLAAADVQIDKPVNAVGVPFPVRSKASLLVIAATKAGRFISLFDDKVLLEQNRLTNAPAGEPAALALHNALLKVTPVSGYVLFGSLTEDFLEIEAGVMFLSYGLYAYLPTLPDPYAANLSGLDFQFRNERVRNGRGVPWLLLLCELRWKPFQQAGDHVEVSFHFAPLPEGYNEALAASAHSAASPGAASGLAALDTIAQQRLIATPGADALLKALAGDNLRQQQVAGSSAPAQPSVGVLEATQPFAPVLETTQGAAAAQGRIGDNLWDRITSLVLGPEVFALLDVSSNADLLGVSFGAQNDRANADRAGVANTAAAFPLQVKGMNVVSEANKVRFFTVPQISWEPVLNLAPQMLADDPPTGPNYYPDDGGPTRIVNNSTHHVALAPLPLTQFLVDKYLHDATFTATALFTLPYGLRALALLRKEYVSDGAARRGANLLSVSQTFAGGVEGAKHLRLDGGAALTAGESDSFMGCSLQTDNILDLTGNPTGSSTLGHDVATIFNNQFLLQPPSIEHQVGVPLTRIDLSGYGASSYSNWLSPHASLAATSQARFEIFVGRCAHEVIQVKSILYPWGIHVVRTITLFRTSTAYNYRWDSGWRAQSAGKLDFTYFVGVPGPGGQLQSVRREGMYEIHPGVIHALWNVQEIKETTDVLPFLGTMSVPSGGLYVDENGEEQTNTTGAPKAFPYELQPVFFHADVEVENPVSGYKTVTLEGKQRKVCASRDILGFVQIAPRGMPLTIDAFHDLVARQGTIGGPLDCVLDINASGQQLRARGFDITNSVAADGSRPIFVAAARGSTILPKDGAWALVQHRSGTGTVTPVPETLSVPLIRIGALQPQADDSQVIHPAPATQVLRIAETTELLRAPVKDTVNYGFLHSTDTQKALYLTPAYAAGVQKLLSKTPPLFADAFRLVNSKAIFPNIGDAVSGFGDAINLGAKAADFAATGLSDAGAVVREIMQINQAGAGGALQQGYKLLKSADPFDLPTTDWNLVDLGSAFKIYIEYKADKAGALDYNVDSFASKVEDTWKSHMQNVGLVVDLGPIKRLVTIKGGWNANKGVEAQYGGTDALPAPQMVFAPELNPIIAILQILQELSTGNYAAAFSQGVRLAMSNKAGSWEYKFEASKEIPVLHFPPPATDSPLSPLRLEAGFKLGAYFDAALKVTTDPKQLLPTAGGYIGFFGRLSVMCLTVGAATIYAVGQVNLDIGADTANGPTLHMKFGFGAQIVVGLPVVGNVSVLYMVGAEIFLDSALLQISAFMLFQGQADLLAGMVCITITIEAKGTISRAAGRTDLAAQGSFAIDISVFLVIDIDFSTSWQEQRQIA